MKKGIIQLVLLALLYTKTNAQQPASCPPNPNTPTTAYCKDGKGISTDPEIRSGSDTLWEAPGFYRTNSKHIYLRGSSNDYTISDGLLEVNKQGVIVGDYHIRVPIGKDETGTLFEDVPVKFKGRKLD
jgi:hypothetical protein